MYFELHTIPFYLSSVDCGKPLTDSVLALGETSLCSALQPEVFFCGECEVPFSDRNVFANHMYAHHEDMQPFKCAKCNKSFAHFTSLRRHRQGCEDTFRVCCPICNRSFHRKDYLKDHLRGKCGHSSKQKFSCKICKTTFYFKSELLIHKQKCCSQKSNTVWEWRWRFVLYGWCCCGLLLFNNVLNHFGLCTIAKVHGQGCLASVVKFSGIIQATDLDCGSRILLWQSLSNLARRSKTQWVNK